MDVNTLQQNERDDVQDILWFWYHHATGLAIWHYKDKQTKGPEISDKTEPEQDYTTLVFISP